MPLLRITKQRPPTQGGFFNYSKPNTPQWI
nr:MAG TPA: hypothetical protein [Caudoviricetes sp.]